MKLEELALGVYAVGDVSPLARLCCSSVEALALGVYCGLATPLVAVARPLERSLDRTLPAGESVPHGLTGGDVSDSFRAPAAIRLCASDPMPPLEFGFCVWFGFGKDCTVPDGDTSGLIGF